MTFDSKATMNQTNNTNYFNIMSEIKERFPEFRTLNNNELELVLKLYDAHLVTPMIIQNASYYVSGALMVLLSFMFTNAQNLKGPTI